MGRIRAERVLLVCAAMTVVCSFLVMLALGVVSRVALFGCYAFEAIIFPTIFAISVRGLGKETKLASSLLMMTPLGGAVGTLTMGAVADVAGVSSSFVVPCVAYAVVLIYAAQQQRFSTR